MSQWLNDLQASLRRRELEGLLRRLRVLPAGGRLVQVDGKSCINFASNDYLALSADPRLIDAANQANLRYGVGAAASRLVCGHLEPHENLERELAAFKHAQAALLLPTGYMANLAALTSLAGPGDLICMDKLNHASLIDAAAQSGARVRIYPHQGLGKLKRLLEDDARAPSDAPSPTRARRRFIVTDSVFSMDGDCANLPALCELRNCYDAILVLDDAHATGVLGPEGAGLAEHWNLTSQVDVTIWTASKALGGLGGIISGPRVVIDTIINHARSFIYTTGVPPAQAAAIHAALAVVAAEPQRRHRLAELSIRLRSGLHQCGWPLEKVNSADPVTPIIPLVVGDAAGALALSSRLQESGFLAPAIRPPTVPPASSRVRFSLRADHTNADIDGLIQAIGPA